MIKDTSVALAALKSFFHWRYCSFEILPSSFKLSTMSSKSSTLIALAACIFIHEAASSLFAGFFNVAEMLLEFKSASFSKAIDWPEMML